MDHTPYIRPSTPQALLHRAPDKQDAAASSTKPRRHILLMAPTSVAGKVQIATSVSNCLSCPLFQGDSLHASSAKAASVGASRSGDGGKARYQRMWLSKMTRTGLLFPEESRPANAGFTGFGGGSSSTSTSRRGSASSISSEASSTIGSMAASTASSADDLDAQAEHPGGTFGTSQYINRPTLTISEQESRRRLNPALMVLTHPELEVWHREAIREATGEYGIGVIFVPLYKIEDDHNTKVEDDESDELPVLQPLDPTALSRFTSFDQLKAAAGAFDSKGKVRYRKGKEGTPDEMVLVVDVEGSVEDIIEQVVAGVRDVMLP